MALVEASEVPLIYTIFEQALQNIAYVEQVVCDLNHISERSSLIVNRHMCHGPVAIALHVSISRHRPQLSCSPCDQTD